MPLITRENAVAMGKLSAVRRKEAKEREERAKIGLPSLTAPAEDQRRRDRVQKQIDKCDDLLERCRNPRTFVQLTAAKEKLWNLVFPKPGSLRPRTPRDGRGQLAPIQPISEPLPLVNESAVVVPPADQNHNAENVQS